MGRSALRKPPPAPVTIEEFDRFLDTAGDDARQLELIDGAVIMQSNPNDVHEQIVANLGIAAGEPMAARGCRVLFGGMRLQRDDDAKARDKPKPDLIVRCGPLTGRHFVVDPIVVVEVLSPSTMDVDRGPKLKFYKSLPTLQHIVIVYQDQMRIEHDRRAEKAWQRSVLTRPTDVLDLDAVEFRIELARIYLDVDLP